MICNFAALINSSFFLGKQTEISLNDVSSTASGGSGESSSAKRDFSNPMFDAMGSMEAEAEAEAARGGAFGSSSSAEAAAIASSDVPPPFMEPPSAIIAPSSVTHKGSPKVAVRQKELDPSTVDTGKDTQCLVEEGDSEC